MRTYVLVFCLTLGAANLRSQTTLLSGHEAIVERKSGGSTTERIVIADPSGITVLTADGNGRIKFAQDQIERVRFVPPSEWAGAQKSLKEGKLVQAESLMKPYAIHMAPMTTVIDGDAGKYIFAYTDVLRSQGKYKEALDFLEKTPFPKDASVADRARHIIVSAYCQAMLGKVEDAERMLNLIQDPSDKSSLFTVYQLASARVSYERKDYLSALDDVARILAMKRLGSDSYDEALFRSAEIYDQLNIALAAQREALLKDAPLKRQMQQDNLDAISRFEEIKSAPLEVAAIWDGENDFAKCAVSARLQLCRVYPSSPWTTKAREKLPEEALTALLDEASRDAVETARRAMEAKNDVPAKKDESTKKKSPKTDSKSEKKTPAGVLKLDDTTADEGDNL